MREEASFLFGLQVNLTDLRLPRIKAPPEWGIEPVDPSHRILDLLDYFVLWSSLGVGLLVLLAGSQLVPALGLGQALFAILLGTAIGNVPLALLGHIGGRHGIPSMVLVRPSFGIRGSLLPTILNVIQLIGWTVFEISIMASAADAFSSMALGYSNFGLWAAIFASICTLMAIGGPLAVVREWLEKFAIWLVYGTAGWLLYGILSGHNLAGLFAIEPTGGLSFSLAMDLVIAMPISWMPLVADYNRFASNPLRASLGTYLGYFVANVLFYSLGALLVLATGRSDLIGAIAAVVMGIPALLIILVDETDNAFADIYSAAVSIQNAIPKLPQRISAPLIGLASLAISLIIPIEQYEWFLLWIGSVFIPLFGVVIADNLIQGGEYDMAELYKVGGKYWYFKGVNPVAIVSWGLGVAIYYLMISQLPSLGASIPSLLASSAIYLALAKSFGGHR